MKRKLISEVMREMGRKGGKKSAKTRAERLTPERRSEIARNAAAARWAKEKGEEQPTKGKK